MYSTQDNVIHISKKTVEPRLLDVDNFCRYLSIGKTQGRKILRAKDCSFSLRIGNRLYADKPKVDNWLDKQAKK